VSADVLCCKRCGKPEEEWLPGAPHCQCPAPPAELVAGARVMVNTGGHDSFGVVVQDDRDWRRLHKAKRALVGASVLVKFDNGGGTQWIPTGYVRVDRQPKEDTQ